MPTTEAMTDVLNRYLDACQRLATADIVGCFADDGELLDPELGLIAGHAAIRRYFEEIYGELSTLSFELSPLYWCRDSAAVQWRGTAGPRQGGARHYQGVDVFTFDDAPRIRRLWAFWRPAELSGA